TEHRIEPGVRGIGQPAKLAVDDDEALQDAQPLAPPLGIERFRTARARDAIGERTDRIAEVAHARPVAGAARLEHLAGDALDLPVAVDQRHADARGMDGKPGNASAHPAPRAKRACAVERAPRSEEHTS